MKVSHLKYGIEIIVGVILIIEIALFSVLLSKSKKWYSILLEMSEQLASRPIFSLSFTEGTCEGSQENQNFGVWPGTVYGCNCTGSYYDVLSKCHKKVCRKSCTAKMKRNKCHTVKEKKPVEIFLWGDIKGCKDSSYWDIDFTYEYLLKNSVKKDENCESGFHKCGILDTLGQIMCIPDSYSCPTNLLLVSKDIKPPSEYSQITVNTFSLDNGKYIHYSNEATNNKVIISFKLSDGDVCVNPGEYNSESTPFILDYYESYGCKTKIKGSYFDDRYEYIDEMNKYSLYQANGILGQVSDFKGYPVEELRTVTTKLYTINYSGIDKQCFFDKKITKKKLKDAYSSLKNIDNDIIPVIISSVCLLLFILGVLLKLRKVYDSGIVNIVFSSFIICFVLSLFIFLVSRMTKISGFPDLTDCGDHITTTGLNIVSSNIKKYKIYYPVAIAFDILLIIWFGYNIVWHSILCCTEGVKSGRDINIEPNYKNSFGIPGPGQMTIETKLETIN